MKILHISDIHMGVGGEVEECEKMLIADKIASALQECQYQGKDLWPDILVATGDFTTTATTTEFEQALAQLQAFYENKQYKIKNMVMVPGNHDYMWRENGKELERKHAHIGYRNFLTNCQLKGIVSNETLTVESLKKEMEEYLISHFYIEEKDFSVLIIGMNSVILDSEKRAGQGYFGIKQQQKCRKLIEHYKRECKNDLIIISAFHHHVLPVSSVEYDTLHDSEKFSLTIDARRTLDFFVNNGVQMALHGHQHQPSIVSWKNEVVDNKSSLYVISVGSMMESREDLGDISRNNFMIYDIERKGAKVYLFETDGYNRNRMILDSKSPYFLSFDSALKKVKCDVVQNAFAPSEIENINYSAEEDNSDLYYLFLNVVDCDDARIAIEEFIDYYNSKNEEKVLVCGIHHLYGKFDILIKYRCGTGNFRKKLEEHLVKTKDMNEAQSSYFMDVTHEQSGFYKNESIMLLKNPNAYLNSTWNMATLTIYTERKIKPQIFLNQLMSEIDKFDKEYNTKIEDIIRNFAIGQDQNIIFELFISCYQFPMLTRFTNLIEGIIKKHGVDKSTHIIYYFDERHV